jgi:ABC-type multidrug transport system ATPase subunit
LLGIASFHFFVAVHVEILGANGAGKTTTFRMLINDLKPTSGEIFINGRNINKIVVFKPFIGIINFEIILESRS